MKLGEALQVIEDNYSKLETLASRAENHARIREDDVPAYSANTLLEQMEALGETTRDLAKRISRTVASIKLESGQTLGEARMERKHFERLHNELDRLASEAEGSVSRSFTSEAKLVRTVEPADARSRADETFKKYRVLDTAINAAEWNHDLVV